MKLSALISNKYLSHTIYTYTVCIVCNMIIIRNKIDFYELIRKKRTKRGTEAKRWYVVIYLVPED